MMKILGTATPPVRVTVVSSSPVWPVTVIAVLGLVLALLSLGWQVVTYIWSGSRVHVDTRFGIYLSSMLPGLMKSNQPTFLTDALVTATGAQGFPGIMVIAVIQNVGRLPVTIQECMWQTKLDKFGAIDHPLGTPLPHRLEPGAQCLSVVDLATAIAVLDAPLRDKTVGRQVWPVVQLGNGRHRKGKALEIPVKPGVPPTVAAETDA